jgi:hypothetical protein
MADNDIPQDHPKEIADLTQRVWELIRYERQRFQLENPPLSDLLDLTGEREHKARIKRRVLTGQINYLEKILDERLSKLGEAERHSGQLGRALKARTTLRQRVAQRQEGIPAVLGQHEGSPSKQHTPIKMSTHHPDPDIEKRRMIVGQNLSLSTEGICVLLDEKKVPLTKSMYEAGSWAKAYKAKVYRANIYSLISKARKAEKQKQANVLS